MPRHEDEPVIELLYFQGCPNHDAFLPHLRQVLTDAGIEAPVQLLEVPTAEDALRLRFLGSPSLRIDGVDVDPSAATRTDYGLQCRLYMTEIGPQGAPPDQGIIDTLNRFGRPPLSPAPSTRSTEGLS